MERRTQETHVVMTYPPTHDYSGSSKARQEVGKPGHCEACAEFGHVRAHPDLGCGDVGCNRAHDEDPASALAEPKVVDLDAIEARLKGTSPGPWMWRGSVDHGGDIYLAAKGEHGLQEVLGTVGVDRVVRDRDIEDCMDGTGWSRETAKEWLERVWAYDPVKDGPREDQRICFFEPNPGILKTGAELAVFQVARARGIPDDTPRTDPRIYRGDIVDVRNPDARFIAAARQDVEDLVAEVKRLRKLVGQ
jgi:hypothetical protein